MLPILKEYFASRLFLKVNISSACRDYKYIPYPSLEVQSSVRDIRQKSKLDCNDHCQNSQRCPPSQHPLCWLTITTMVLAMGGGWRKGGVATFFQAPSQQCLTRPVIALHQGQGCEAGWNTLLPIHGNTANSALRRDEIKVADSPTL